MEQTTCVCVLGMHRSGTSLVARLLNRLGVSLGPEAHLSRSRAHNARGYWEHRPLVSISDQALAAMGGTWDEPPELPPGWERSPELDELRDAASSTIEADFHGATMWGWKDPRLSLTLPLFVPLLPADRRWVVCVRNPTDVAASLERNYSRRGRVVRPFPHDETTRLWLRYTSEALIATESAPRAVVAYDDVLASPDRKLASLAALADVGPVAAGRAAEEIRGALRHHRTTDAEVFDDPRLPDAAKDLYRSALAAARGEGDDERLRSDARAALAHATTAAIEVAPIARSGDGDARRISIAMATFDGVPHVREQLESIAAQTRRPHELVVVDDRSADGTVEVVERFARESGFTVRIAVNDERRGSTRSFQRAIAMCRGDVIALCDQDDVWLPEKLDVLDAAFGRPSVAAAFTDAEILRDGSPADSGSLWESLEVPAPQWARFRGGSSRDRVEVLCRSNVVTGATLAFRSRYRELLLPIPVAWIQDGWIALLLAAVADVAPIPSRLVRYRIHAGQQVGTPLRGSLARIARRVNVVRRATADQRVAFAEQSVAFALAYRRLVERAARFPPDPGALSTLDDKVRHSRAREAMAWADARWRIVASELARGRYHRFSSGVASAAKDLARLDAG